VDAADAIAGLERISKAINLATRLAVSDGMKLTQKLARANAPMGTRSGSTPGALRRSILGKGPTPDGLATWTGKMGPTVIYGRIRELGGMIVPTHAPILHWVNNAGNSVYAMHSDQKLGSSSKPYLKPAVMVVRTRFQAMAERRWAVALLAGK
jgi:hypothetical protein